MTNSLAEINFQMIDPGFTWWWTRRGLNCKGQLEKKRLDWLWWAAASDWTKPVFGLILIDPVRFWSCSPIWSQLFVSLESHGPDQAWWVAIWANLDWAGWKSVDCSVLQNLHCLPLKSVDCTRFYKSIDCPVLQNLHWFHLKSVDCTQLNLHLNPVESCAFQERCCCAKVQNFIGGCSELTSEVHRICICICPSVMYLYLYLQLCFVFVFVLATV